MADDDKTYVDLTNANTLAKYERSSAIANAVLAKLVESSVPGTRVVELCALGDKLIVDLSKEVTDPENPKMEKGVAFPTCFSVNNCACNFCPDVATDKTVLKDGDVVKIELGVHIDGLVSTGAHTFISTSTPQEPVKGKVADVICAAYFALEAAVRLCRPGKTNKDITEAVANIAKEFQCTPVSGMVSHQMLRFVLEGDKTVENKDDKGKSEEFEVGEIYGLSVMISTGEGNATEKADKPAIFRLDPLVRYNLKMKTSRTVMGEIKRSSPAFPFAVRSLKTKGAKLGLSEMSKHDMLKPYPVLYEKPGEFVAHFKTTVLIQNHQIAKLVAHAPAFVQSDFSVKDAALNSILQLSLNLE